MRVFFIILTKFHDVFEKPKKLKFIFEEYSF